MRYGLLALSIVLVAGFGYCSHSVAREHATAALSDDARTAIEVRCDFQAAPAASECREMLTRLYAAGRLDPDKTLRVYCNEVKQSGWGNHTPKQPRLCRERYGDWGSG